MFQNQMKISSCGNFLRKARIFGFESHRAHTIPRTIIPNKAKTIFPTIPKEGKKTRNASKRMLTIIAGEKAVDGPCTLGRAFFCKETFVDFAGVEAGLKFGTNSFLITIFLFTFLCNIHQRRRRRKCLALNALPLGRLCQRNNQL